MKKLEIIGVVFIFIFLLVFCFWKARQTLKGYGPSTQQGIRKIHIKTVAY